MLALHLWNEHVGQYADGLTHAGLEARALVCLIHTSLVLPRDRFERMEDIGIDGLRASGELRGQSGLVVGESIDEQAVEHGRSNMHVAFEQ